MRSGRKVSVRLASELEPSTPDHAVGEDFKISRSFRVALKDLSNERMVGRSPELYGAVNERASTIMLRFLLAHSYKPALSERAVPPLATLRGFHLPKHWPMFSRRHALPDNGWAGKSCWFVTMELHFYNASTQVTAPMR